MFTTISRWSREQHNKKVVRAWWSGHAARRVIIADWQRGSLALVSMLNREQEQKLKIRTTCQSWVCWADVHASSFRRLYSREQSSKGPLLFQNALRTTRKRPRNIYSFLLLWVCSQTCHTIFCTHLVFICLFFYLFVLFCFLGVLHRSIAQSVAS